MHADNNSSQRARQTSNRQGMKQGSLISFEVTLIDFFESLVITGILEDKHSRRPDISITSTPMITKSSDVDEASSLQ